MHDEAVVIERVRHGGLQGQSFEHAGMQFGFEDVVAVRPRLLGGGDRGIGVTQQVGGTDAVTGHGHADAGAQAQAVTTEPERPQETAEHTFEAGVQCARVAGIVEHQREFVGAEARQRVAAAQAALQPLSHQHDDLVAGGVTEAVVDQPELIEIEHRHGDGLPRPARLGGRPRDPVEEQFAVRQLRQRIVQGLVLHLLFEAMVLADVAHVQHDAGEIRVMAFVGHRGLGPGLTAVVGSEAQHQLAAAPPGIAVEIG